MHHQLSGRCRYHRRLLLESLERRHLLAGTASITGMVWQDLDGDGVRGAAEPAFAGVTVYLDLNDNGVLDAATEPARVTPADGSYSFTNLDAGGYVIRQVLPANYRVSYPQASGQRMFAVDTSEFPINRIVELDLATGAVVRSLTTPVESFFSPGLAFDGTTLYFLADSNDTLYALNPATGAVLDSTVLPPTNYNYVALAALEGKVYVMSSFPNMVAPFDPATKTLGAANDLEKINSNFRLHDVLGQSARTGELLTAPTWEYVGLIDPQTGVRLGSVPRQSGYVRSVEAIGDEIYVGYEQPSRLEVYSRGGTLLRTLPLTFSAGDTAGFADLSGAQRLKLAADQNAVNINFGAHYVLGSISGTKWQDTNGNGVRDSGEPPLDGKTIYLDLNDNSVLDAGEPTAVTGADGTYRFSNVAAGNYAIRQVLAPPRQQTFPAFTTNRLFMHARLGPVKTILELNPSTGATINSFAAPPIGAPFDDYGLAFDGTSLFLIHTAAGASSIFYELNPDTGSILNAATLPAGTYGELATLNGLVYIGIANEGVITVFNPRTNTVERTITVMGYPPLYIGGGLGEIAGMNRLIAGLSGELLLIDPASGTASIAPVKLTGDDFTSVGEEIFATDFLWADDFIYPVVKVYSLSGALLRTLPVVDAKSIAGATGNYGAHLVKLGIGETVSGLNFASDEPIDPPRVVATSIAPGDTIEPGAVTYTVIFNKPMNVSNLDAADYGLKGMLRAVTYSAASAAFSPGGTALTLNYIGLPDDEYRLTLNSGSTNFTDEAGNALDGEFSGAFPSGDGIAGGDFVIRFVMDRDTEALPLPLTGRRPLGSLVYDAAVTRVIAFPVDSDSFTLAADPGQTISVLVTPSTARLRTLVLLQDPSGAFLSARAAPAPGQSALLQMVRTTTGGNYTVTVGNLGVGVGVYSLRVYLNAAIEAAVTGPPGNKSLAAAQSLDAWFRDLAGPEFAAGRAAVVGSLTAGTIDLQGIDSGWWDSAGSRGTAGNKNYIAGLFAGVEYRNFAMFDLRGIDRPIASAQFSLANPSAGFTSPDGSETYTLFDISTPLHMLAADGAGHLDIFDDLGTGVVLGSRVYTSADNNSAPLITLNSAGVASVNAAAGGIVALGGAVTTISGTANQAVFSGSNSNASIDLKHLVLEIPGPDRDYYSFTLQAGHSAAVGLAHLAGSGATIEIQDTGGATLAAGVAGGNFDQAIGNFVAPAAGTYYVVVSADASVRYNLLVTRGAALDAEPNGSPAEAQNVTPAAAILGAVAAPPGDPAGSVVVPSNLAASEGPSSNSAPFNAVQRYQQIYSAAQFTAPGVIDAIRFRRDTSQGPFTTSGLVVQIHLGYAATSVLAASTTFADNIAGGYALVYDGPLTLSSSGTGTPRPFDVVIDVDNVFHYDPALGDLLLDIRVLSPSASFLLDASGVTQQSTTMRIRGNLFALAGTIGFSGSNSPYGLITQFDLLTPTPEEDWYAIEVPGPGGTLALQTSTPAGGDDQFLNRLNPRLELYDADGGLVATGTPLADGRNEMIHEQGLAAGTYRVRVSSEDGTWGEYVLAKNVSPAAGTESLEVPEDAESPVTLAAVDAENQPLTYAVVTGPAHGTLSGTAPNLTYTPDGDYHGSDSFTYRASDGLLDSNLATVTITVAPVNDPPSFAVGDNLSFTDHSGPLSIPNWATAIAAGPPNESNQALTFHVTSDHPELFAAGPAIDAAGTLTFTPAPNVEGVALLTVILQDDGGTDYSGEDATPPLFFTIEVTKPHRWHNSRPPHGPPGIPGRGAMDVDDDANLTPTDVVLIVNYLNAPRALFPTFIAAANQIANGSTMPFYDVDADDNVTPTDVVLIVNVLNAGQGGPLAGEGTALVQTQGFAAFNASQPDATAPPSDFDALLALLAFDAAEQNYRRRRGR